MDKIDIYKLGEESNALSLIRSSLKKVFNISIHYLGFLHDSEIILKYLIAFIFNQKINIQSEHSTIAFVLDTLVFDLEEYFKEEIQLLRSDYETTVSVLKELINEYDYVIHQEIETSQY